MKARTLAGIVSLVSLVGCVFGRASHAPACDRTLPAPASQLALPEFFVAGEVPPETRVASMWFQSDRYWDGTARNDMPQNGRISVAPIVLERESPITVLRLLSHELAHWQFHSLSPRRQARLSERLFRTYGEEVLLSFLHAIDRPDRPVRRPIYDALYAHFGRSGAQRYVADEVIAWTIVFEDIPFGEKRERELARIAREFADEGTLALGELPPDEEAYVILLAHGVQPCTLVGTLADDYGFVRTREHLPAVYWGLRQALGQRRAEVQIAH